MSDARCLSNQVHFFISSYPCQALQLADQQSVAVCFNQAAPPLLQTGPDYREREQGSDEGEERKRTVRGGEGKRGSGGRTSLPRHHRDERGEAGDMQIQNVQNGEQGSCKSKGLNNRVNCIGNEKMPRHCRNNEVRLILYQRCHFFLSTSLFTEVFIFWKTSEKNLSPGKIETRLSLVLLFFF